MTVEQGATETFAIHCGQLFDGDNVQANAVLQVLRMFHFYRTLL